MARLDIITPDKLSEETGRLIKHIRYYRDLSSAYTRIANALAGKTITKRNLPQLEAMFPEARRVYIHVDSWNGRISIEIAKEPNHYGTGADNLSVQIAAYGADEKRKVDKAFMLAEAVDHINHSEKVQRVLDRLPEVTAQYNALATAYAAIRDSLPYDLPWADCEASRRFSENSAA